MRLGSWLYNKIRFIEDFPERSEENPKPILLKKAKAPEIVENNKFLEPALERFIKNRIYKVYSLKTQKRLKTDPDSVLSFLRNDRGIKNARIDVIESNQAKINVIFLPSINNSKQQISFCFHGKGGSMGTFARRAAKLWENGHSVCLMSIRGNDGNPGSPEQDILIDDFKTIIDSYVLKSNPPEYKINLEGFSFGSAFALHAAAASNLVFDEINLVAPISSAYDMAEHYLRFLPKTLKSQFLKLMKNELWDNCKILDQIKCRQVNVYHSRADKTVPLWQGEKLFDELQKKGAEVKFIELKKDPNHDNSLYEALDYSGSSKRHTCK